MTSRKHSLLMVLTLWASGLGAAGQFAKIAVIFKELQSVYPEAGQSLGFLVSLISFLGIVLGLFAGLVVARIGARRMLLWALTLGGVLSLWQATLPDFPLMLASRLIEGISHLIIVVAAPTMIARVASDAHRSAAMTLWSTFFGVSFSITAFFGIPLVAQYGVGSIFVVHGVFMLGVGAVLAVLLPRSSANLSAETALNLREVLHRHAVIYKSPTLSAPALGWLFYTLTYVAFLTLLPGLVAPENRALVTGLMPLAGIVTSMTLGILLLRWLPAVWVICCGFVLAASVLTLLAVFPGSPVLCVALIGALGFVQGASFAAIPQLNPDPQDQAYANGAMAQMGNLGNTIGTPIMLVAIAGLGNFGMITLGLLCYGAAVSVHLFLQARRRLAT